MARVVGWLDAWARRSNATATANARGAATACSRRLLERAEVEAFLASLATGPTAVPASAGTAASVVAGTAAASVH